MTELQDPRPQEPQKPKFPSVDEIRNRIQRFKDGDKKLRAKFRQRIESLRADDYAEVRRKMRERMGGTPPPPKTEDLQVDSAPVTEEDAKALNVSGDELADFSQAEKVSFEEIAKGNVPKWAEKDIWYTRMPPPSGHDVTKAFGEFFSENLPMWSRELVNKFGQGIQKITYGAESLFNSSWPDWNRAPDDVSAIQENIEKIKSGQGVPEPDFDIARIVGELASPSGLSMWDVNAIHASRSPEQYWTPFTDDELRKIGKDPETFGQKAYVPELEISDADLKKLKEEGVAPDQAYMQLARERKILQAENRLSVEGREWLRDVEGIHEKVMTTGIGEVGMIASHVLSEIGLLTLPPGGAIMKGVAWGTRPVFALTHMAATPLMKKLALAGQTYPAGWLASSLLSSGAKQALSNGAREAWKGLFRGVLPRTTGYGSLEWVRGAYDESTGKMHDGYERIIHAAQAAAYWPVYELFGAGASMLARTIQKHGLPGVTSGGEALARNLALQHMKRINMPRQEGESLRNYAQRAIDTWAQDGFRGLTKGKYAKARLQGAMHNILANSIASGPEGFGFAMLDQQFRAELAHSLVGAWDEEELGPEPPRLDSFWSSLRTLMGNWLGFNAVKATPWAVRSLDEAKNLRLTQVRVREARQEKAELRDRAKAEGRSVAELPLDAQQALSDLDRLGLRSSDEHTFRASGREDTVYIENEGGKLVVRLPAEFVSRMGLAEGRFVGDEALVALKLYELELLSHRAEQLMQTAGEQIDTDGTRILPGEAGQPPLVLSWNGKDVVARRLGRPDPGKPVNLKIQPLPRVSQQQAQLASLVQRIATQTAELVEGSGLPEPAVKLLQKGLSQLSANLGHIPRERSSAVDQLVEVMKLQGAHLLTPEGAQPGIFGQLWNAAPTPQVRLELLTNLLRLGSGSQHYKLTLERMLESVQPEVKAQEKTDETTDGLEQGRAESKPEGEDPAAQEAKQAEVEQRERGEPREADEVSDGSGRPAERPAARGPSEPAVVTKKDKAARRKKAAKELKKLHKQEIADDPRVGELIDIAVIPTKERTKAQNLKAQALGRDPDLAKMGLDFGDYAAARQEGRVWDPEAQKWTESAQDIVDAATKERKDKAEESAEAIEAGDVGAEVFDSIFAATHITTEGHQAGPLFRLAAVAVLRGDLQQARNLLGEAVDRHLTARTAEDHLFETSGRSSPYLFREPLKDESGLKHLRREPGRTYEEDVADHKERASRFVEDIIAEMKKQLGQPSQVGEAEITGELAPPTPPPKKEAKKAPPKKAPPKRKELSALEKEEAELRRILEDPRGVVLDEAGVPLERGKSGDPLPEQGTRLRVGKKDYSLEKLNKRYAEVKKELSSQKQTKEKAEQQGPPIPEEMRAEMLPDYVPVHTKEEARSIVDAWSGAKKVTWQEGAQMMNPEAVFDWARSIAEPWAEQVRRYHPNKEKADALLKGLEKAMGGPLGRAKPTPEAAARVLEWINKTFKGEHPGGDVPGGLKRVDTGKRTVVEVEEINPDTGKVNTVQQEVPLIETRQMPGTSQREMTKVAQAMRFFRAGHPHLARLVMEQQGRSTGEVVFQYLMSHWKPHERAERAMAKELERLRNEDRTAEKAARKMLQEWTEGRTPEPPVRVRKVKSVEVPGGVEFTQSMFNALVKFDPQYNDIGRLQDILRRARQVGRWKRVIDEITTSELKDLTDSIQRAQKAMPVGATKGLTKDTVRRMREALGANLDALRARLLDTELMHYQELEATWEVMPHDPMTMIVTGKDGLLVKYELDINGKPYWYVTPASNPSTSKGIGSLQFRSQTDAFRAMDRFLELGNWQEKPKGTEDQGFGVGAKKTDLPSTRVKLIQDAMDLAYGIYKDQNVNAKKAKPADYDTRLEGRELVVVPPHWKGLRDAMGLKDLPTVAVPEHEAGAKRYKETEIDPRGQTEFEAERELGTGEEMKVRMGLRKRGTEGKILHLHEWPREAVDAINRLYSAGQKLYGGTAGTYLQNWVKDLVRDLGGAKHSSEVSRGIAIKDIRKEVPNLKTREDMTFYRQELAMKAKNADHEMRGNPDVKGDTFEAMRARIPENARKMVEKGGALDKVFADGLDILESMEVVGPEHAIEMYVQQFWEVKAAKWGDFVDWVRHKESLPMGHKRKFESYQDGMKAGYTPRTLDIAEIALRHIVHVDAVRATMDFVDGLKSSGAIRQKTKDFDPEQHGYVHPRSLGINHPILHRQFGKVRKGKKATADVIDIWWYIHKDVAPYIQKVLRPPPPPLPMVRNLTRAGSAAKRFMLSFSGFHVGALMESAYAEAGFEGAAFAAHLAKQGMKEAFGLGGPRTAPELIRKFGEYWAERGLMIGGTSDIQRHVVDNWIHNLYRGAKKKGGIRGFAAEATKQTLGRIQKFNDKLLWEHLHPGLKLYMAETLKDRFVGNDQVLEKYRKMNDGDTNRAMKHMERDIARHINNAFGTQNTYDFFARGNPMSSRQRELAAQFMFLAPDWTLSNMRVAMDPVLAGPVGRSAGRRYWARMLAATTVGLQAIQGIWLNYYFNNMATEEQKEQWEESGKSYWLTDNEHWPAIRLYQNDKGQWVYIEPFKQMREVLHWFGLAGGDPVSQLGNKMSPVVREAYEQFTGRSPGSHYPTPYEDMDLVESVPLRVATAGEKFLPISFSGFAEDTQFAFIMPMRRGMTSYSYVRDMTKLMTEFSLQEKKVVNLDPDSYKGYQLERMLNAPATWMGTDKKGSLMSPQEVVEMMSEMNQSAIANNLDIPRLMGRVHINVREDILSKLMATYEEMGSADNWDDYQDEIDRLSLAYLRLDPISASTSEVDADLQRKFQKAWHDGGLPDMDQLAARVKTMESMVKQFPKAMSEGNLDRSIDQKLEMERRRTEFQVDWMQDNY